MTCRCIETRISTIQPSSRTFDVSSTDRTLVVDTSSTRLTTIMGVSRTLVIAPDIRITIACGPCP